VRVSQQRPQHELGGQRHPQPISHGLTLPSP
jgi:hypothetical protein